MQAPPLPVNEAERLQALKVLDILDSQPEARFDRITRIAQHLFDVPIALISLVDVERQWFKSRQGLQATETPRSVSFCGHAILQDDIFYIPDAQSDPRFADNPLVTGPPNVRAYAGAPLRVKADIRIGTLCIIDTQPRTFSTQNLVDLRNLADWVQSELNMIKLSEATTLIRAHEAHLKTVLSSVPDCILTLDEQARICSSNDQIHAMFGLTGQQVLGAKLERLLPEFSAEHFTQFVDQQTKKDTQASQLASGRRADGTEFPVDLMVNPMRVSDKLSYVVSIRDVSERQALENMKREFVSIVSHELRTPLTAIRGALGLVVGGVAGPVPDKINDMLKIADDNCVRLIRLVNDILDIEKLELGRLKFVLTDVSLPSLLSQAVELNNDYAKGFGVHLEARGTVSDSTLIRVDADRMIQVLTNLLANAVKFSPEREAVLIEALPSADGDGVRINICDRGPGIPAEMRGRIFDKFQQIDSAVNRRKGGTGLGLSIAKAIVEAFGGRIGVSDRSGGGSVFWLELPAQVETKLSDH